MKLSNLDRINELQKSRKRLERLKERVGKERSLKEAIIIAESEPDERITVRVHTALNEALSEVVASDMAAINAELVALGVEVS